MDTALFIDANIWLDFYRIRHDAQKSLLEHLESVSQYIITTDQIEMEYKKHRQHEIVASIGNMNKPEKIQIPPIVAQHKSAKAYKNAIKNASDKVMKLKKSMESALITPHRNDDVYKVAQRIFHNYDSDLNLNRNTKNKILIRRLAFRRFIMGYPPRKKNDTSMGDSINWEWIVHVCKEKKLNAIIVSRDGDYGVTYDKGSHINDWLSHEFKERVSRQKCVTLHGSLSEALRVMKVKVTSSEMEEELTMMMRQEARKRNLIIGKLSDHNRAWFEALYGETWERDVPIDVLVSEHESDKNS